MSKPHNLIREFRDLLARTSARTSARRWKGTVRFLSWSTFFGLTFWSTFKMQSTPHKYDKRLCGLFCDGKQNKFKISPCCLRTKSCHLLSFSHQRRGTPEALHLRFSSARTNWKRKLEGWCVKTAQPYKEVWKMTWSVKKTRNFVKVAVIFGFSRWPFDFFLNFFIRLPRLFSRFLSK